MAFLARAVEEAWRARGSTAPNPLVGAVVVRDGAVISSGFHTRAGAPHAEVMALTGCEAQGATLYVTLEPCCHHGKQPPCVDAIIQSGVSRVVVGVRDPNPRTSGGGIEELRAAGIEVEERDDPACRRLIEDFSVWISSDRPYLAVKMAMSLDGAITSRPAIQEWITSDAERTCVRELRIEHDAVMVGAGTVRVDDPLLTVRPPYARMRPYVRVIACETDALPLDRQVFAPLDGYARTIVLAPCGARERFRALEAVAEVAYVGDEGAQRLDLGEAMRELRRREVYSVLCEGGPTLAARLIADRLVDRFYWAIAPVFLRNDRAVPVLAGADLAALGLRAQFDQVERVGDDVLLSGRFETSDV